MTGRRTRPGEEETTGGEGRGEGRLEEGTGRGGQTDRRTRENGREKERTGGAAEGVANRGAERRGKQKGETVTHGQRATSERDGRGGREREMEAERKAGTDRRKRGKKAGEK